MEDWKARSDRLERLAILGEMFAEAAHEVNNLVGAIAAYAELELYAAGRSSPSESLEKILELSRWAGELMQGAMSFGAPKSTATPANVDIVMKEVVDLFHYKSRRGVRFLLQAESGLPPVSIPDSQLRLVLANLVRNALDAVADRAFPTIRISATRTAEGVDIGVWNSGPPLSQEVRERLFEQYFTTKPTGKGTGLGLAIAKRLVMQAGGRISARNESDGVLFTLVLPTADRASPRANARAEQQIRTNLLTGQRVLVVDDDPAVRDVLKLLLLQVGGGDVVTCSAGEEALELLEEQEFDAVLLDLRMIGLSGEETFRLLPRHLQERVVFITGDAMNTATTEFLTNVKQPALLKPVTHKHLVGAIQAIVKDR